MFDYYKQLPATQIIFGWYQERSVKWLSPDAQAKFDQFVKTNPGISMQNITRFSIDRLNHEESQWILLPDGKLVLMVYFTKDVAGLKNNPLHATDTMRKECFVVFDKKGNLLYQL